MAIGSTLRDARVQRGLTIDQVAQDTRISARFLEALESEMFDQLPAPVYVRGFLRSYANYLRVDVQPLIEELAMVGDTAVGGPNASRRPSRPASLGRSADPFRPTPPPMPEPSVVVETEDVFEPGDDEWQPEPADWLPARDGQRQPFVVPPPTAPEYDAYEEAEDYHPRRVEGVLSERETVYNEGTTGMRLLAIAGGGAIIVLFIVVVAMLMGGGDGGSKQQAGVVDNPSPSPDRGQGTVITVGSATAVPSPSPSVSPTPNSSPTPSAPGAASTTPAPTPTRTFIAATPTETPTPTEEPTPIPSPTIAVTPFVPTPTVGIPPHAFGFGECIPGGGSYDCGQATTWRVVCYPNGWFLDLPPSYTVPPLPGWRVVSVPGPSLAKVSSACS